MWKIIWIDLGTTNSACAYILGEKPEVIPNAEWERTTPSVVYIKWDEVVVGTIAKRKAVLNPKNTIFEAKRLIGRKFDEIKKDAEKMPYDIVSGPGWECLIKIDDKEYRPAQIAAFVLQKIKKDAEKYLGDTVDGAVITVPAHFNDSQRQATKAAGEIAGLKVERIINEPTAAALAYGAGKMKDEIVAVYDFGGGTFDITILSIGEEGTFEVLSTAGDTQLWGADIDARIVNWLIEQFKVMNDGIDLSKDINAMARLKDEAEKAKIQLSQSESVDITIPYICMWPDNQPRNLQETLTRAQFENMIEDLVDRTIAPVHQALKDAGKTANEINEVILVWGSTRVPLVIKKVWEALGKEPKATVNPDEAVAIGAAVQWGIIKGNVSDILLLDVTPLSLWVEVEGRIVDVVIPRNTTIPVKKQKTYSTAVDNQPAVTIHVVQGERPMASDNKSLWQFNLEWIPPAPRWTPQIEVTFDMDANGILNVSAKEKTTGKEQTVTIQGATNMSEEEINKMQEEAEKFADEDAKKKELIESRHKYESLVFGLEKLSKEQADKLDEAEKTKIWDAVKEMETLKADEATTKEIYDSKYEELNTFATSIYQKMQQSAGMDPNAAAGGCADGSCGTSEQTNWQEAEVIDADDEEEKKDENK